MGGRLYTFSDAAVTAFRKYMADNRITPDMLFSTFDLPPSSISKLLSPKRHPKRVRKGTFEMLNGIYPEMKGLMPPVKRKYPDRKRDGETPSLVRIPNGGSQNVASQVFGDLIFMVIGLEKDSSLDAATLARVRAAIASLRAKYLENADGEEKSDGKTGEGEEK